MTIHWKWRSIAVNRIPRFMHQAHNIPIRRVVKSSGISESMNAKCVDKIDRLSAASSAAAAGRDNARVKIIYNSINAKVRRASRLPFIASGRNKAEEIKDRRACAAGDYFHVAWQHLSVALISRNYIGLRHAVCVYSTTDAPAALFMSELPVSLAVPSSPFNSSFLRFFTLASAFFVICAGVRVLHSSSRFYTLVLRRVRKNVAGSFGGL